jgi:hypothetical protein
MWTAWRLGLTRYLWHRKYLYAQASAPPSLLPAPSPALSPRPLATHLRGGPQVADLVGAPRGDIHHLPHMLLQVPPLHAAPCSSSQAGTCTLSHHLRLQWHGRMIRSWTNNGSSQHIRTQTCPTTSLGSNAG